jgi:hypothetical protein
VLEASHVGKFPFGLRRKGSYDSHTLSLRGAKPREPALSEVEGNLLSASAVTDAPQALSLASAEIEPPSASESCLCTFSHVSASAPVRKTWIA